MNSRALPFAVTWHFLPAVHNSRNPPCGLAPTKAKFERRRRRCSKRSNLPTRLPGSITTLKTPSLSVLPDLRFKVEQRCSTWQKQCTGSHPSLSRRCEPRPRAASHPSMHADLGSAARTPVRLRLQASAPSSSGAKNLTVAGAWLKSCFTLSPSPSKNGAMTPNPSFEATSSSKLHLLPAAPHVER